MKMDVFRQSLLALGWKIIAIEEIKPDEKSGVKHVRAVLQKVNDDGSSVRRLVGYWQDTLGAMGDAGDVYPDRENGDFQKVEPPTQPVQVTAAVDAVSVLSTVVGAKYAGLIPGAVMVQAFVVENGVGIVRRYAVYKDDADAVRVVPMQEATA